MEVANISRNEKCETEKNNFWKFLTICLIAILILSGCAGDFGFINNFNEYFFNQNQQIKEIKILGMPEIPARLSPVQKFMFQVQKIVDDVLNNGGKKFYSTEIGIVQVISKQIAINGKESSTIAIGLITNKGKEVLNLDDDMIKLIVEIIYDLLLNPPKNFPNDFEQTGKKKFTIKPVIIQ